jgi:hypothetical protein
MKIITNWDSLNPFKDIIGKKAIVILDDNTKFIGTVQAPNKFSGMYPVLVNESGEWTRLNDEVAILKTDDSLLVKAGA